jgi:hypothetical protein
MPGSAHPWSLACERLIPHREVPISEVAGQQSHYFWLDSVDAPIRRRVFVVFVQTVTAMVSPDLRSTPQNTSAAGPRGNRPRPTSGSHWRRVWPHRIVALVLTEEARPAPRAGRESRQTVSRGLERVDRRPRRCRQMRRRRLGPSTEREPSTCVTPPRPGRRCRG